jgi:TorA maturation chaperone TorD
MNAPSFELAEAPDPEEAARANFYGLLARLFYGPPGQPLLEALADAGEMDAEDGVIGDAWQALKDAAAVADAGTVREEYESVFIGTGKAPVTLYTTAYTLRYSSEVPLVALRADLAALGLSRHESSHEPEDHIAALCDTMRHLIAAQQPELAQQSRFFSRWIAPAAQPLCDAIAKPRSGPFYELVGHFAKAFFELERSAFDMFGAGTPRRIRSSNEPDIDLVSKPGH